MKSAIKGSEMAQRVRDPDVRFERTANGDVSSTTEISDAGPTTANSTLSSGNQDVAGTETHGGDGQEITFQEARTQAVTILERSDGSSWQAPVDNDTAQWLEQHQHMLAQNLRMSKHVWYDVMPIGLCSDSVCGCVNPSEPLVVHLSRARCPLTTRTKEQAGKLLIHEATHALGNIDEEFADKIAEAVYYLWNQLGRLDRSYWEMLPHASLFETSYKTSAAAIWNGREMIINADGDWTGAYNVEARKWRRIEKLPRNRTVSVLSGEVIPLEGYSFVHTAGGTFMWGGCVREVVFCDAKDKGGYILPYNASQWRPISPAGAPTPRAFHATASQGRYVYLWGGQEIEPRNNNQSSNPYLATGSVYDTETDTWKELPPAPPELRGRAHHTAIWTGTTFIIWGGLGYDGNVGILSDGAIYDPTLKTWTYIPATNSSPDGRYDHKALWAGDRMVIWGGERQRLAEPREIVIGTSSRITTFTPKVDGKTFDPKSKIWQDMAPMPVEIEWPIMPALIWTGNYVIVSGPSPSLIYHLGSNRWLPPSQIYGPSDLKNHVAVWTGLEMLIWSDRETAAFYP